MLERWNLKVDYYELLTQLERTIPEEVTIGLFPIQKGDYLYLPSQISKIADFMVNIGKLDRVNVLLDNINTILIRITRQCSFNIYFTYVAEEIVEMRGF